MVGLVHCFNFIMPYMDLGHVIGNDFEFAILPIMVGKYASVVMVL